MIFLQIDNTITDTQIYPIAVSVILLLLMLVVGAVMAAAEVAFFNMGIKDVNYLKSKTDRISLNIVSLLETPKKLSSVLKSVKIFCIITGVGISIFLVNSLMPPEFSIWLKALILLVTNIFSILLIIEIMPKVYARKNKLRTLLFSIPIIMPLFLLLKNIVARNDRKNMMEVIHEEEALLLNNEINLQEALESRLGHQPTMEEIHIFKGILRFGNISVSQVMTSRMNISAINVSYNTKQVIEKVNTSRLSRMPIYQDNIDTILGFLFTKDLLHLDKNADGEQWKELIRPVIFIPETKLIEDLFKEFQDKSTHIAIVVDEFGGTSGLVTLEDIMEQIVGEISDEFDSEKIGFVPSENGTYIFNGTTSINEIQRVLNLDDVTLQKFSKNQVKTIGGVLLEIAKSIPKTNEWYYIDDYELSAIEIENNAILKVSIRKNSTVKN